MHSHPARGAILVLLAASLWGTTGTAQSLAGGALAAAWVGALRLVVAALFFAAVAAASSRASRPADDRAVWAACIGAGLCMAAYNLLFFAGIRTTGVALGTAVALGSGPVWAGVLEALWRRRGPVASWWLGTALAVVGGALMTGVGGGSAVAARAPGLLLCVLAGLSYAIYTLLTKRLAATTPAPIVTLRAFAVAAAVALPLACWQAGLPAALAAREVALVLYLGVVTAGVAYLLFSLALRHVSAATGVTLALFEPVMACLLAASVLGEPMGATAWVGLALVLVGVLAVVRSELSAPRRLAATPAAA